MAAVVSLVLTPSFYSLINLGTQPWISLEGTVRCDLDNRPCLYYHRMKKMSSDGINDQLFMGDMSFNPKEVK